MDDMKNIEHAVEHLYQLNPSNLQEDTYRLAQIMGIKKHWVIKADDHILLALCGVILMPHLSDYDKMTVMRDINSFEHSRPEFYMILQAKISDALVNPDWAPWSMTTEQLVNKLKSDERISKYMHILDLLGIGFSLKETPHLYSVLKGTAKLKGGAIGIFAGIMVIVINEFNDSEKRILKKELKNRSSNPRHSKYI